MVYKEVEFPAVSFCNLNSLRRSQLYLEENVDLVDVIATLDQATEDQLSGVSQSSRRRRRRRTVNDDVTATVDSPVDKHRATQIVRNDERWQSDETAVDNGDSYGDVVTNRERVTADDYATTDEVTSSAAEQEFIPLSDDVGDANNDRRRRDAMTARTRRRRKYLIFGDFC